MVLGHRDHYLTSGTMIQALLNNKPVIVPNIGLTAKRVILNKIGMTYKYCSLRDLNDKVNLMKKTHGNFMESVNEYRKFFSKESIFKCMDKNISTVLINK